MTEQWLTIPQAAQHFGVSENAIRLRLRRRKFAGSEKRDGTIYINVSPDQSDDKALVIWTGQPTNDQIERLIAAQERTNELLERQLALLQQQPKKWRWPWQPAIVTASSATAQPATGGTPQAASIASSGTPAPTEHKKHAP